LHSIKAGLAINENNLTEAEELFQKIIRLSPTSFVKENIEIRLMAKTGNMHEVKKILTAMLCSTYLRIERQRQLFN
jgi:predicted Zn-dependent protease